MSSTFKVAKLSAKYIDIDGLSLDSRLLALENNLQALRSDFLDAILLESDAVAVSGLVTDAETYLENSYKL
jgi:hypothetical protein